MKKSNLLAALLLMVAGLQTAMAQKMTLYMTGNQVAEYSLLQLDSLVFTEGDSSGSGDSTDPSVTGDAIDVTNKAATLVGYATSIRDNLGTAAATATAVGVFAPSEFLNDLSSRRAVNARSRI